MLERGVCRRRRRRSVFTNRVSRASGGATKRAGTGEKLQLKIICNSGVKMRGYLAADRNLSHAISSTVYRETVV